MTSLQARQCPADKDPEVLIKKILTKKELGHIKVRYFKKGTLGLTVDSSTWLYYFNLQKRDFLGKLHTQSGAIENIRFYIGEIK